MNIKTINLKLMNKLFLLSGLFLIISMIPFESFAAATTTVTESDAISQTLCNVIAKLTGPIGKGIATISIVVLGIGMFLGKLSWPVAIATALGIGMIFGAANIVQFVGGGTNISGTNGAGGTACSGS